MQNVLGATTIEQLVGASGDDRRGKRRFSAGDVPTAAAPYVTSPLPPPSALCPVKCQNISRQGIAFYWPCQPAARFMLIRLGVSPNVVFLTARVAGSMRNSGDFQYLVRCQFLRKVEINVS